MPEKPLLILPTPGPPLAREKKRGRGGKIGRPSRQRQTERLGPKFDALQRNFELRLEATGTAPEDVLVLETVGLVEDFLNALRKIKGMEWLGEIEQEDIPPDDDFFALDKEDQRRADKTLKGRIFLVFTNHRALKELLSLWKKWQEDDELPYGKKKWEKIFSHLRDIRVWGVKDRLLETGVLDDWQDRIKHNEEVVPCEIELWYRVDQRARSAARDKVVNLVSTLNGNVISEAVIEPITYQALLVRLPVAAISHVINESGGETALLQCEQIQFFRATGQMAGVIPDDEHVVDEMEVVEPRLDLSDPVIALLDGFPLQHHQRLTGRLVVDDPDDIEVHYQAQERCHGTAMASLILHGDLNGNEQPLTHPLYIRPILQPNPNDWLTHQETVPENTLVVDLIHRAVRRMFEGDGDEDAAAPKVCIINLSIGIRDRMFDGALSPLAKLLDWLAWEYQVLFVVSAGNHLQPMRLGVRWDEFNELSPEEQQEQVIKAIAADTRHRRLLSPAEAMNILTVGAVQSDRSNVELIPHAVIPFVDEELPSPINSQGMGFRRIIKPEILAPGGKVILTKNIEDPFTCNIYDGLKPPGQKVAAPGSTLGDVVDSVFTRGTSNATAITSRYGVMLYDLLQELHDEPGGELIDEIPISVWIKALLVHSAKWGTAKAVLENILRTSKNSRQFKEYITRLLGYGNINIGYVQECTDHRVTALSGGALGNDQVHIHHYPLPPSLSGQHGWRRLAITLAWLTPVNPQHQKWRRAALWFEPPVNPLKVAREQADWQAVKRSTVQHEILEGDRASAYIDGANLEIKVCCKSEAGSLVDEIPYALVTTLEVDEGIGITIYEEVRTRVHAARIRVSPAE